jgi:photosystem II stability/assembly factor-like uncharacterized protein
MGTVISLWVDPLDVDEIYAGTNASGLWKTTDGGSNWTNLTDAAQLPGMGIQDVIVAPDDPNVILIATGISTFGLGYGLGVLRSADGGATWDPTGLTFAPDSQTAVERLLGHPTNSQIVYALVKQSVYKTVDGGTSWTPVLVTTNTNSRLRDIEMKPGDPNTLYVAGDDRGLLGGGAGIWKSTDGGSNWTNINAGLVAGSERIEISVTPAQPNSLFALYGSGSHVYLQRSDSGGATWLQANMVDNITDFIHDLRVGYWTNNLGVSPVDPNIIYAGGLQTFRSSDGGASFTAVTTPNIPAPNHQHDDVRRLLVARGSAGGPQDVVLTGNDGGVNRTMDGGVTWTGIEGMGLGITQFYGIGGIESHPGLLIGGTQDLSSMIHDDGSWTNTSSLYGDGGEPVIDFTDSSVMYAIRNGKIRRSDDGGETWASRSAPGATLVLNSGLVANPWDHNGLFATWFDDVWKTEDQGLSWLKISNQGKGFISALAVAPSNPSTLYFAYDRILWTTSVPGSVGIVWKSTDGGSTWTDISAGLQGLMYTSVSDIAIHPSHPERIWVAFSGFWDGQRVFYSSNGGATWANVSQGLPNFPVNKIVYQKWTTDVLYAATDVGVFRWDGEIYGPPAWEYWSDGLPVAIATDLEINYAAGKIRAATFGRGLWESDLPSPLPTPLLVTVEPADVTVPSTIPSSGIASFTVVLNQPGPYDSIQWCTAGPGGVCLVDGGHISGTQTTTLTISPVGGADYRSYFAVVCSASGCVKTRSARLINGFPIFYFVVPMLPRSGLVILSLALTLCSCVLLYRRPPSRDSSCFLKRGSS